MAVAFDAVGGPQNGSGSPTTWSHTCTGSNRALYVGVAEKYATAVTGATYNGNAMTLVGQYNDSGSNVRSVNVFRLVAPSTGANTVSVSQSASHTLVGMSISFTGVDQTTPDGTAVPGHTVGTAPTVTVADGDANAIILDFLAWYVDAGQTMSVGASQTSRFNTLNTDIGAACSTEPGSSSVDMTWTASASTYWAQVGIAVLAAAAAPARTYNLSTTGAG